ncbi:MAG TPA: fused MFS/spermidine synthase [Pyrinomonadaceae bacterium]
MTATNGATKSIQLPAYSRRSFTLIAICFVLSGATALIYEVLWARMLGLVFGATTLAVSAVLAAFMGGLAIGSALAGRFGAQAKRPVRWYGVIEIAIGLYALLVPLLFRGIDRVYALVWQQLHPESYAFAGWRFLLSSLVLIVPTALMGATLPLLSSALARSRQQAVAPVTRFYMLNLSGAIAGTIAAGFYLLPAFGVRATIYFAAAINLAIGLAAILVDWKQSPDAGPGLNYSTTEDDADQRLVSETAQLPTDDARGFWLGCAFVSGFVTISTQVAWTRVLTMVIGSSTYAFSIVVALFLLGLASGAHLISRHKDSARLRRRLLRVQVFTAASLFVSVIVINAIPALLVRTGFKFHLASWPGLLTLQILSATVLILLPAILMGMVMPLVLVWASRARRETVANRVGRSYAINTVGAIAGSLATAFVLIPKAGTRFTILFATSLSLIIAFWAYRPSHESADRALRRSLAIGLTLTIIVMAFVLAPRLNLSDLSAGAYDSYVRVLAKSRSGVPDDEETTSHLGPETHRLLMYREGPTATVSVRKDWGITSLAINGRTNASDRDDMPTQVMLGQLPVLIAPQVNKGLIIGFASGVTAGSVLQSSIGSLECVELEPASVYASRYFEHVNNHPLFDSRVRLIIDDARTYLRVNPVRYDMIVSEPSHPWVPGVANLFTREFFELGRERLNDDGVFVQWLQIYQLSTESLRSVLATYQSVFPHVMVFRVEGATKGKDLILLGSRRPLTLAYVSERMREPRIGADLARVGIKSEQDVRTWFICDETQLAPAVAGAVINTDDNMHIETVVPREAFLPFTEKNAAWIEALAARTKS